MFNIVTITFSPCIDKSTSIAALIPEKKLQCAAPKLEPGGGGINVARAIKKLGGEAIAIFPSGGYTGRFFNHLMEKENIPVVVIETLNETRENIIVLNREINIQYRFGMPGTSLDEKEWKQVLEALEELKDISFVIASGSLPPGVPLDIYAQIGKITKSKNAKFVVDTCGEALKFAVNEGAYLLKPNLGELASLAGKKEITPDEAKVIAGDIIKDGKCEVLVVSMGEKGALLVTKDMSEIIISPPVRKESTVGAGDSMLAGIVYYLSLSKSILEAVEYGVACGTAATMHPGTELCKKEDADKLYALIKEKKQP